MVKRILIATGGTGGHIYPGLVTAQELRCRGCDVTFIGAFSQAQERIEAAGFECVNIEAKGYVAKGLVDKTKAIGAMVRALFKCWGVIRRMRPDVVLGFGGYSSFPAIMAAFFCRVPAMIHEQNARPGQANKLLAYFVSRVAVGFKETQKFFPEKKVVWTGNPLREFDTTFPRAQAIEQFGLDPSRMTVLVFGGSQGSRVLNGQVVEVFADIPLDLKVQVIHITGGQDFFKVKGRYAALGVPALVREYMEKIETAYAAADLVVGRAGAGTVMELGIWGVAALLIPYPGANGHQKYNARVLERLGAAVIIEEKSLRQDMLRDKIFSELRKDPSRIRRSQQHETLKDYFIVDGALRLANEVLDPGWKRMSSKGCL